ncbi:hypothetical protein BSL78_06143 [Apostichopus japonicus]|uniref:CASP C-terminal domain-containing protein n=1 Tax=Stichopus japonicus TaxID=307972 RepID=A0A2G8L9L4_STIJA|nr:hypothetical protein BSL78_06143 [Apostichopus japonicus]
MDRVIPDNRYEALKLQCEEHTKTTQEQKTLIVKLEQDLLSVNSLTSLYRGEGEGQASPSSDAEVIAEAVRETATLPMERTSPQLPPSSTNNAAESLLPIVSSQRERFRLRNQELEGENRQQQQQILILRTEVDNLRSDNVKLYEKIKFLQSYPTSKSSQKSDDAVSRYSSQYEARLDPFNSFSRKERQRRYMGLSPFDKATLNVGRTILASKLARLFAFCYFMFLHMLVFLVLYKMAHISACKKDNISECFNKFQQHMHDFHPGDQVDLLHHEDGHDGHNI